jgi:hypothetical protein
MSEELRLPDHLAACEARLAAQPLAASPLNRDELMYRAGWAAAEAALARSGASSPPVAGGKRTALAWSLACSAVAASIAVAMTLSLAARYSGPPVASAPPETPLVASPGDRPKAAPPRTPSDPLLARLDALIGGAVRTPGGVPAATLWALSRRERPERWDQPILASNDAAPSADGEPTLIENATATRLLDEYLPRGRGAAPPADEQPSSGVNKFLRPLAWGEDTI